ncbi:MAG: hypothetical protein EBR88_00150 [Betaproteobacteria bacterium]|nr:hypothetical protein [Betaproteobacteria bacterium]
MTNGQSLWVEASAALDQLFDAHAKALGVMRNAPRNCVSHFAKKGKDGKPIPDYADLAMILDTARSALSANGLSVTQSFMPLGSDGTLMLVTTLGHKSGQFQRSFLPMKGNIEPQKLAAAATYLKRVALCALLGIAADDDDDGVTAQHVAHQAAVDEEIIEEKAMRALSEKTTPQDRQKVVEHAARLVSEGTLSPQALARLKFAAAELDSQGGKDKPRREMAAAS